MDCPPNDHPSCPNRLPRDRRRTMIGFIVSVIAAALLIGVAESLSGRRRA